MKNLAVYILAATMIASLPLSAWATLIIQQSGQNDAYLVSSVDLLQTSVSSTNNSLTLNVGENTGAGGNTSVVLNNGVFGLGSSVPINVFTGKQESLVIESGTITYTLDTSLNTLGYTITSIQTFAGWSDFNRGSQAYTVSVSQVGSAIFTDLAAVLLAADGFTQERFTITEDATGILATGVDEIRFTFPTQQFSGVGYKELDVFGYAVVPEPSTLILFGLGMATLSLRRKRLGA